MKRSQCVLVVALLLVAAAGCTAGARPSPTPMPTLPPPPTGSSGDLMPRYPNITRSADSEEERKLFAAQFPAPLNNAQVRGYTTTDPPATVIAFYEAHMPDVGWQLVLTQLTDDGGLVQWQGGKLVAWLLVAQNQGETVILLEWGEPGPAVPM